MTDPPNTPPTAGLHEETARLMELVHAQTRIVCGPDNVLDPLDAHCAALDALVVKKDGKLEGAIALAKRINDIIEKDGKHEMDNCLWTPTIHAHATVIQEDCAQALALTPSSLATCAVVEKEEVEELRRDKERLDWLGHVTDVYAYSNGESVRVEVHTKDGFPISLRPAIDAARQHAAEKKP